MRRPIALMVLALAGCASNMTDEAALTLARTRDSTVRTSERLAEVAERLPRTMDETNLGVARITSATSLAIVELAGLSETAARLSTKIEPDLASASKSVASILGDVAKVTEKVAAQPPVTSHWEMLIGAIGGATIILLVVGLRAAFNRAVEAAVKKR